MAQQSTFQEPNVDVDNDKTDTLSFREKRLRRKNEMKAATDEADLDNTDDRMSLREKRLSRKSSINNSEVADEASTTTFQEKQTRRMSVNPNAEVKTYDKDELEDMESVACLYSRDKSALDPKIMEEALAAQEQKLRNEFEETLRKETDNLKARFDYILQNEQLRASNMLHEAHRERKEKVAALQQQLECKNLAALMYVMCAERTKCKLEKLQLIEAYTNYINMLNEVLAEGQELILTLSRGYKTAARIDFEWKEKMNKIIDQFLKYIYHFSGTPPEQNQFYFNLPELLSTESPIEDDPNENPIEEEPQPTISLPDLPENKTWWERLDDDCRPFIVFGDMSSFDPPQRRETLKTVKAAKTAPKKWREYVFHDMFLHSGCPVADVVKHEYLSRLPASEDKWNCQGLQHMEIFSMDATGRRQTTASLDLRGNMGSILKIITATSLGEPITKANLLGARDSMEIASTTKMRTYRKSEVSKVEIKVGNRRTSSFYDDKNFYYDVKSTSEAMKPAGSRTSDETSAVELPFGRKTSTGHRDSLEVIPKHVPEADHKINYEKVCPMPRCQRMHVDSFTRSLPTYMQANPFTHYEQTFDEYETCTSAQLEILQQRLAEKKQQEREVKRTVSVTNPLLEWAGSVGGIGVQTSFVSEPELPPCTCRDPNPSLVSITGPGAVFSIKDLLPAKINIDSVARDCFWDKEIEFDRFKVVGEKDININHTRETLRKINSEFTKTRLQEITKILKANPSLLDLFQANTK